MQSRYATYGCKHVSSVAVAFSTRMLLKQIRYIIDEEVDGDDMDYFKEEALGEWMHTTYGDMSKPSL